MIIIVRVCFLAKPGFGGSADFPMLLDQIFGRQDLVKRLRYVYARSVPLVLHAIAAWCRCLGVDSEAEVNWTCRHGRGRCRSRQIAGSQNHDRDNYPIRECALGRPGSMAAMTAMLLDISGIVRLRHSLERGRAWR